MVLEPEHLVLLALLGGMVALDGAALGQFMFSRPVVAATLAGWFLGAPAEGAVLGLLLETLHLTVLPSGATRYPEAGPAAVAASALYVGAPASAGLLLTAVVFGLLWEWLGGMTIQKLRQVNIRLAAEPVATAGQVDRMARGHAAAIGLDFLRGMAVTVAGLLAAGMIAALLPAVWPAEGLLRAAVAAGGAAGAAASLRFFTGRVRLRLFALGGAVGLLLVLLR